MTFEEKMKRLEEIHQLLKEGNQSFSEMTHLFEEGIKLSDSLEEELSQAEKKIRIISNGSSSNPGEE